jgi:predicted phosphodiesterase
MPVSFCSQVSNSREVVKLFREAGNIKLCLSGHTHMNDRCEFGGTTYVCAGAVSGAWWRGDNQGFAPSYTQIDLHSDGEFALKTVKWDM